MDKWGWLIFGVGTAFGALITEVACMLLAGGQPYYGAALAAGCAALLLYIEGRLT